MHGRDIFLGEELISGFRDLCYISWGLTVCSSCLLHWIWKVNKRAADLFLHTSLARRTALFAFETAWLLDQTTVCAGNIRTVRSVDLLVQAGAWGLVAKRRKNFANVTIYSAVVAD